MKLSCLTHLYTPAGLLIDGDGDGLPDGLGVRFSVGATPGAIDVAARLGLETAALTPGFTQPDAPGIPLFFGPGNPDSPDVDVPPGSGLIALTAEGVVVTGETAAEGWAAARWLAETFPFVRPGGPLLAEEAAGRSVVGVVLRSGAVVEIRTLDGSATQRAPARVADKLTLVEPPDQPFFAANPPGDLPPEGLARLFTTAGLMGSTDSARHDLAGWQVQVTPETTRDEIAGLCELAARTGVEATGLCFPLAVSGEPQGTRVVLADKPGVADEAEAAWVEGTLAFSQGCLTVSGSPTERALALMRAAGAGLTDGLHATLFTRRASLAAEPAVRGEVLFDLELQAQWEVTRFRRLWQEKVAPTLKGKSPFRTVTSLEPALPARTDPSSPLYVDVRLSEPLAVRQALALELEQDLVAAGFPCVAVRVRSAYKQGFHWLEEEMVPQLRALQPLAAVKVEVARFAGKEGTTPLEMPIRWLQELYPADELLAQAMGGVPVEFALSAEEAVTVAAGEALAAAAPVYRLTAVRPDGSIALTAGFTPVFSHRPYLPEFPERGDVHPPTGLLRVERAGAVLWQERLETDSEALWTAYQQDVLPRLRQVLTQTHGDVPDPSAQPFFGALVVEAALSEDDRRLGIREEQISPLDAMHEDLYFYTLDYLNQLGITLAGKGYGAPGSVEPWVVAGTEGPRARVRLYARQSEKAVLGGLPERAAVLPAPAEGLVMNQIIGPDDLPRYLAYLATLPGVRVWRTGLSYGGRPTWALSVTAETAGTIAPPQKLTAWRPTFLVNARHHANEISSTNSILKLAEWAARKGVGNRLNLVLSPMENMDGAAIHYAMQAVHPNWKLHAARFNAAGVEFAYDTFAPEPQFGESRTLPTLWRAFLPDLVLDDHGYPSHEWVQPFSGYNSPPYFRTSWWMPNALIYGIYRWMDAEKYPLNGAVQEGVRDALARRLTADETIESYTRTLLDRFMTYGRQYVPEKFPLEMHEGFISQTGRVADGPEARSYVGRFPHLTAAELVTEVPDETAQGDYLALCATAHLEGDFAVVDFLTAHPQPVIRRRWEEGGRVLWTVGRRRPYRLGGN